MTRVSEEVGAKELTDGSVTTLHSHSGGGGVDVKNGVETGISCGSTRSVVFTTPFSSTPSVVVGDNGDSAKEHTLKAISVTVNGFTIQVDKSHTGGACSDVGVYWIATNAGNV